MNLRFAGVDYDALWFSAARNDPESAEFMLVLEKVFDQPVSVEHEHWCRASTAGRLLDLEVESVRVLMSRCRTRLLWLCRTNGPDAARAVELKLASQGFEVWSCEPATFHAQSHAGYHVPAAKLTPHKQ
jgi:hypothetical protein